VRIEKQHALNKIAVYEITSFIGKFKVMFATVHFLVLRCSWLGRKTFMQHVASL